MEHFLIFTLGHNGLDVDPGMQTATGIICN